MSDMETSSQFLPPELEAAVAAQLGGPVSMPGQHGKYVIMNVDVYGGVLEATPEELSDSMAAIKRSLAQAAAGGDDASVINQPLTIEFCKRQTNRAELNHAGTIAISHRLNFAFCSYRGIR